MYQIMISYRTGDSFKSEDLEVLLEGEWSNLEILKENINRIKDHYDWWYLNNKEILYSSNRKSRKKEEPKWHIGKPENSVVLRTDEGVEYMLSAFWCGYFESLYGAKAVLKNIEIGFEY